MEKCGNCKFWKKTKMPIGNCRRYPPNGCGALVPIQKNSIAQPGKQQMHLQTMEYTIWSRLKENEWCGEYEPKPEGLTQEFLEKREQELKGELNVE